MNIYEKNKIENSEVLFRELKLSSINNNIKDLKTSFNSRLKKDYIKLLTFLLSSNCLIGSYNMYMNNEIKNQKSDQIRLQKESYSFFDNYTAEYNFTDDDVLYVYFDWVKTSVYNETLKVNELVNQRVVHEYSFKNLEDYDKLKFVRSLSDLILILDKPEIFVEEISDYTFNEITLPKVIIDNEVHLLLDTNQYLNTVSDDNSEFINHLYELSKFTALVITVLSVINFHKYKISKEEQIKTESFLRVQLKELKYFLKLSKRKKIGVTKEVLEDLKKLGFIPSDLIDYDIIPYDIIEYLEYLENTVSEQYNLLLSDDVPFSELEVVRKYKMK